MFVASITEYVDLVCNPLVRASYMPSHLKTVYIHTSRSPVARIPRTSPNSMANRGITAPMNTDAIEPI